MLSVTDRRYRITQMKTGEVCIYDDKKRHVYLKQDGIEIDGADSPITVKTTNSVTINAAANINLNASANVSIKATQISLDADNISITAKSNVTVKGSGIDLG